MEVEPGWGLREYLRQWLWRPVFDADCNPYGDADPYGDGHSDPNGYPDRDTDGDADTDRHT